MNGRGPGRPGSGQGGPGWPGRPPGGAGGARQFDSLEASELYCPRCRVAQPVKKRLLLVLPEGDQYDYVCAICGESLGKKVERGG